MNNKHSVIVRGDKSNEDLDAVQKSQSDRRRRISRKDNPEILVDEDDSEEDSGDEVSESEDADRTETSRLIEEPEPEPEPEIYENLTNISQSYYIYPTTMLPLSRAAETAMQPLLYIAEPFPSVRSICRQQSSCCDGGMLQQGQRRNELDLITGDIEMGINDIKGNGLANSEMDSLLGRLDNDKTSRLNAASPHYHDRESQSKRQNIHRQDGLYSSHLPIFARILMSSENVDSLPIAKLVESNIGLARVTQRTLRELDGGVENERLRRQWISMSSTVSNGNSRRVKGGMDENSARRGRTDKHDDVLYYNRIAASGRSVSSVHQLLNQLTVGPVLRLIDDPAIDLPCQPVIPEPSVAYGGRLGSWSEHSSNAERLGMNVHTIYLSLQVGCSLFVQMNLALR